MADKMIVAGRVIVKHKCMSSKGTQIQNSIKPNQTCLQDQIYLLTTYCSCLFVVTCPFIFLNSNYTLLYFFHYRLSPSPAITTLLSMSTSPFSFLLNPLPPPNPAPHQSSVSINICPFRLKNSNGSDPFHILSVTSTEPQKYVSFNIYSQAKTDCQHRCKVPANYCFVHSYVF